MNNKSIDKFNEELEAPKVIPQVDEAFEELFSMDSSWSIEERFSKLLSAVTASAFYLMDRQRRTGRKVSDADRDFQQEAMAQLKLIEKCLVTAKKFGYLDGRKIEEAGFDDDVHSKVIKMKSSISDIVANVPGSSLK